MDSFGIQKNKITETACITCIWDADGISVDLNYAYEAMMRASSCQLCMAYLWTDPEDNQPSEALWQEAIEVARVLSAAYNLPLKIIDTR